MMNESKDRRRKLLNCSDKKMRYEFHCRRTKPVWVQDSWEKFFRKQDCWLFGQAMHAKHGYPAQDNGTTWKFWDYQIVEASSDQGKLHFNSVRRTFLHINCQESSPKSHRYVTSLWWFAFHIIPHLSEAPGLASTRWSKVSGAFSTWQLRGIHRSTPCDHTNHHTVDGSEIW